MRFWRRLRAVQLAALVLPTVVLAGWWFVRNAVAFGSPLPPLHPITSQRQVFDSLAQVRGYVAATAVSLVGMYGNGAHFVAISILGVRPLPSTVAVAAIARPHHRRLRRGGALVGDVGLRARARVAILLLVVILVGAGAVGPELGDLRSPAAGALPARRRGRGGADHRLDDRVAPHRTALDGAGLGDRRAGRWSRCCSMSPD